MYIARRKHPMKDHRSIWIGAGLLLALAAFSLTPGVGADDAGLTQRRTPVVEVVEKVSPAVVNISTERLVPVSGWFSGQGGIFGSPFEDLFRTLPGPTFLERRASLGSGVVVDADGYIVTNAHVVSRASQILVTALDGKEFKAQLLGEDSNIDIAVLKAETSGPFPFLTFGASEDLMIGETVVAIGNPFGLQNTVTTGVVSALEREIKIGDRTFPGLLQTDAAINPGNSGGPLVNITGELIGISTAIQAGAEGIGFAIPARRVKAVFEEVVYDVISLEERLGLQVQQVTPGIAAYFKMEQDHGALILEVENGGLGEKAGLQRGDLILEIDGQPVESQGDYSRLLERHGDEELVIGYVSERGGKMREARAMPERRLGHKQGETAGPWFGMTIRSVDNRTARRNGWELDEGVVVAAVTDDSEADVVGIQRGDLIMYIGRFEIGSVADFKKAAREYAEQPAKVEIQVWRPGYRSPVRVILERKRAGA